MAGLAVSLRQDQPVPAMLSQASRRQLSDNHHHHDELLRQRRTIAQAKMRVDVQAGADDRQEA